MDESLLLGLYTADGMQKVDGLAIQGIGIPGGHLMERAGLAVATEILERYAPEEAVVFAGKGNNGGDGFVVARELFDAGVEVTVFLLAPAEEYKGDAKLNLDILARLGVDVRPATDEGGALAEDAMMLTEMADVVVDAIFGTGFTGAAKGPAAAAIELINEAPGAVVSVDIMSGVGANNGSVHGPAVEADLTVTLHAAKVGHFVTPGGALSGEVVIAPIGIPALCDQRPRRLAADRRRHGRAGRPQGHRSTTSARWARCWSSAARRAWRAPPTWPRSRPSGAAPGWCTPRCPTAPAREKPFAEVITVDGARARTASSGSPPAPRCSSRRRSSGPSPSGPGFGRTDEAKLLVRELLGLDRPLLLDADGLYALGDKLELLAERRQPTVITPHEGELGRLIGRSAAEVAAQRLECAALGGARAATSTVVLKGEATIVADPSGRAYVVPTGNPGLATPGTGDVLSGVIVAQLAKGLPATDAACLGAYLHGLAADLAAEDAVGTEGMVASDLFHYLPAAVERLKAGPQEESHEHEH